MLNELIFSNENRLTKYPKPDCIDKLVTELVLVVGKGAYKK